MTIIGVGEGWRSKRINEDVTVTDVWKRDKDGVTMIRFMAMSGMTQTLNQTQFEELFTPQVERKRKTAPASTQPPAPKQSRRRVAAPEDL